MELWSSSAGYTSDELEELEELEHEELSFCLRNANSARTNAAITSAKKINQRNQFISRNQQKQSDVYVLYTTKNYLHVR